jgi:ribosomal protein S18 acetylase RimI-like enzyme
MMAADLPLGMRLKELAGWNQTEADWRRFLALAPGGCLVAEWDGRPVGTAVACVFGHVGWIAMVLVDPAYRGRGIGTRLVAHSVEYLERQAVRSIRLDATPLGRPVYEKLGFRTEYELLRWQGIAPARPMPAGVLPAAEDHLRQIVELDRQLTGTPRARLVELLFRQQPGAMQIAMAADRLLGYATWREGSLAAYLGPAMAPDATAGQELADAVLSQCAGRAVFVDVPCDNEPASRWVRSCGFSVQRPLTRMVRGEPIADCPTSLWASSGPEHG